MPLGGGAIETLVASCGAAGCPCTQPLCAGAPTPLVDDTSVYFQGQDGAVRKVPKGGGATSVVTTTVFPLFAMDATSLWGTPGGTIAQVPKAGGAIVTHYTPPAGLQVMSVSLNADGMVWIESANGSPIGPLFNVKQMPIGGATPALLDTMGVGGFSWLDVRAFESFAVWWRLTSGGGAALYTVPTSGGGTPVLIVDESIKDGMQTSAVFDGSKLFYAIAKYSPPVTLVRATTTAGPPVNVLAFDNNFVPVVAGIAVDACHVYWGTQKGLMRAPK